jgi:acetylornithine/N-succinyldiaminopimelate aminotransferase
MSTYEFPVYTRSGLTIVDGRGYTVRDSLGNTYLDFYGGHAVAILGYGHPGVTRAIQAETETLLFQTNAVDLSVRQEACEALVSIAPKGLDRVFLVNSGGEANENALRIAFWQTGRSKVVALKGAFHGRTAAAAAVTDGAVWYGFPRTPFDVAWASPNDVQALDAALDDSVAAFIFEPVQGVAGAVAMTAEFMQAARTMCTERGVVLIADEVQTGMGRTGTFFAVEQLGIVPDVLTVAKGIGAGFPAAAVLAPAAIADLIKPGWLGTTFGGGPVACAAILATVQAISAPEFLENVQSISQRIFAEARVGPVQDISGLGLLIGLHVSRPAKEVLRELRERGILAGDAKNPNVVRLLPPLIIDDAAVDGLMKALKEIVP